MTRQFIALLGPPRDGVRESHARILAPNGFCPLLWARIRVIVRGYPLSPIDLLSSPC